MISGDKKLPVALVEFQLAPSRTEAERLIKSGALEIDGKRCTDVAYRMKVGTYTVRVGKKWMKFTIA